MAAWVAPSQGRSDQVDPRGLRCEKMQVDGKKGKSSRVAPGPCCRRLCGHQPVPPTTRPSNSGGQWMLWPKCSLGSLIVSVVMLACIIGIGHYIVRARATFSASCQECHGFLPSLLVFGFAPGVIYRRLRDTVACLRLHAVALCVEAASQGSSRRARTW